MSGRIRLDIEIQTDNLVPDRRTDLLIADQEKKRIEKKKVTC